MYAYLRVVLIVHPKMHNINPHLQDKLLSILSSTASQRDHHENYIIIINDTVNIPLTDHNLMLIQPI